MSESPDGRSVAATRQNARGATTDCVVPGMGTDAFSSTVVASVILALRRRSVPSAVHVAPALAGPAWSNRRDPPTVPATMSHDRSATSAVD